MSGPFPSHRQYNLWTEGALCRRLDSFYPFLSPTGLKSVRFNVSSWFTVVLSLLKMTLWLLFLKETLG